MNDTKPWYLSKTIWASLIAVAAAIGSVFGVELDQAAQADLSTVVLQLVTVTSSMMAVFGRLSATSRID